MYEKATSLVNSIELVDPIETANSRRFAGKAVDHYRAEFFKVLDCVEVQFGERFNQDSLKSLQSLENVLLTGLLTNSVDKYPELHRGTLAVQLPLFHQKFSCSSSREAAEVLRGMPVEVHGLFDQVKVLVRILLVVSVSSCEADRSFSALRRLKTWLRATMGQDRLNSLLVCNMHKDKLDNLNINNICQEFVGPSDTRKNKFGTFV